VQLGAVIETWSGSTKIGESTELIHDCYVPNTDDFKPKVGTIVLDPIDISGQNILVQGKNKITISVSGSTAGKGSSIKSYTFSGPGVSYTGTSTSVTSSSTISSNGTVTYTVSVTDYRNRTVSKTATINCYAHSAPYFTSFNAYRVDSSTSTSANDNGTYVRCTYGLAFSSVNNTNDTTVTIYYRKGSGSWSSVSAVANSTNTSGSIVLSGIDNMSTYTIYAEVVDNYSSSAKSTQKSIFGASRILNIRPQGKGIAFGKIAENDDVLPRWLEGLVSVFEKTSVGVRKSTRK
jgi:hypothetical protein